MSNRDKAKDREREKQEMKNYIFYSFLNNKKRNESANSLVITVAIRILFISKNSLSEKLKKQNLIIKREREIKKEKLITQ